MVACNSLGPVRETLPGLLAVTSRLGARIALVDNASEDGTRQFLVAIGAEGKGLEIIANTRNRGYAAAANQAAAALGGCDLFLVNPDVKISSVRDVELLLEVRERLPRAGIVAPRLISADGRPQPSARRFPSILAMAGHASAAKRLAVARRAAERYLALPRGDDPQRVDWAIGGALLIRRRAWEAVGGFDERFFLYLEDVDFCLRCAEAGWETWYVPEVSIGHDYGRASAPERGWITSSAARRHHLASMVRFFAKHPRLAFRC
jgi:N-acetylglucosaminyl-diphospho-decaprenol L-rhamnosyltransferase